MGRPEKNRWVSLLCLMLIWPDSILAATIFPFNHETSSLQDSALSWDYDDANVEDTTWQNDAFSSDDFISFSPEMDDTTRETDIYKGSLDIHNSLDADGNYYPMPSRFWDDATDDDPAYIGSEITKSFIIPHSRFTSKLASSSQRTSSSARKDKDTFVKNWNDDYAPTSASIAQLAKQHSLFDGETPTEAMTPKQDMHEINNKKSHVLVGKISVVRAQQPHSRRFSPENAMKNIKTTTTTHETPSVSKEAVKNQSQHNNIAVSSGKSRVSLQFKFPYRIPFSYVRREINQDESEKTEIKLQNTNEHRSFATTNQRFANGDIRLQRRNRSRRDASEHGVVDDETKKTRTEKETKEKHFADDEERTQVNVAENQQHKSSVKTGSMVGSSSVGVDQLAETNVKSNGTSRPPLSSNPAEVLLRIQALLDRMIRELSTFGQFTLRLIRMTERQDIEQMPDLMKDFEISPEKPIFFIAGGLRKLNGSTVLRTVSSAVPVAANLAENASVVETGIPNQPESELQPLNSTEQEPTDDDGTTVVPILRPSSSLPVESDDDQITTEIPEFVAESDGLDDAGGEVIDASATEAMPNNVTSAQDPLPRRQRRSIPVVDEFNFFPIPGRQARTENPYDNEEEFESFHHDDETNSESVHVTRNDANPVHLLPEVVSVSSDITFSTREVVSPNNILAQVMIDQRQPDRNDEISLSGSHAITDQTGSENGRGTAMMAHSTARGEELSSSEKNIASAPSYQLFDMNNESAAVSLDISTPIHDQIMEHEGSNGQIFQGEKNKSRETSNEFIPKLAIPQGIENTHLATDKQVVANLNTPQHPLFSVLTVRGPFIVADEKPISSSVVDERGLNFVRETFTEEAEISKPITLVEMVAPIVRLDVGGFVHDAERESGELVMPTLPIAERSFHPTSALVGNTPNTVRKVPLLQNLDDVKLAEKVFANQQLLNSQLNDEQLIRLDDRASSADGIAAESRESLLLPESAYPSPTEQHKFVVVDGGPSESHNIPDIMETIIVPVVVDGESASLLIPAAYPNTILLQPSTTVQNDRNVNSGYVGTSSSEAVINQPQESNQNDPQDEIKATSALPQVRDVVLESGPRITVDESLIKESLPTLDNNAESVSLTPVQHVSAYQIQERTISSEPISSINNILIEDRSTSQLNPIKVADSLHDSHLAPSLLQTESSSTGSASTRKLVSTPRDIILDEESSGNEEQTRNKEQSLPVVGENENQPGLVVGKQSKLAGVVMKKVDAAVAEETGANIGRETEQVSSNQATFHAPTVLEGESPIIEHAAVHGANPVDPQDSTVLQEKITDNIDTAVKNPGTVSVQNSDGSATKIIGSIVAPIVSDNGEVRNPIETSVSSEVDITGKENVDILSRNVGKENLIPTQPIISHEPSNVVLSSNEVTVPLAESVGASTPEEDHLMAGSSTENHASITPLSVSDISSESNVPAHDTATAILDPPGPPLQSVDEIETKAASDVGPVNDLPKIEHEDSKTNVDKVAPVLNTPQVTEVVESALPPVEVHDDHAVVKLAPMEVHAVEPVKVEPEATNSVTLVSPVQIPADLVTKISPVELPEVFKVAPVADSSTQILPLDISVRPSVDVNPVEAAAGDSSQLPSLVEPRNPEAVKVDAIVHHDEPNVALQEVETETSHDHKDTDHTVLGVEPEASEQPVLLPVEKEVLSASESPAKDVSSVESIMEKPTNEPTDSDEKVALNPNPSIVPDDEIKKLVVESDGLVEPVVKTAVIPTSDNLGEPILKPAEIPLPGNLEEPVLKPAVVPTSESLEEPVFKPAEIRLPGNLEEPVLKPAVVPTSDSLEEPILKPAEIPLPGTLEETVLKPAISIPSANNFGESIVKPDILPEPVSLSAPVHPIPLPGNVLDPVLKPAFLPDSNRLVEPVVKPATLLHPLVGSEPAQIVPPISPVQPVAAPVFPQIPYIPSVPSGDENIIASLPHLDPDPSFGVKPIDTQPHLQIPGLRPTVPERPHPDYIGYMTQGVDTNPLLFSPPTAPVIMHSPPVYSGYSPAAIMRKQQQMIQNYFNGIFYRRELP